MIKETDRPIAPPRKKRKQKNVSNEKNGAKIEDNLNVCALLNYGIHFYFLNIYLILLKAVKC